MCKTYSNKKRQQIILCSSLCCIIGVMSSSHYSIIKFVGFESIYYAIKLGVV